MPDSRSSLTRFPVNSRHVKPDPQAATPLICCAAKESSGAAVLIEWTPKLENVIARLRAMRKERRGFAPQLFTTQTGSVYTYWGASSAWKRAVKRAGVAGIHFHDLRAKALTDVDELRGMGAARTMGAHSTETQTADYVRNKKARKSALQNSNRRWCGQR